MIGNTILQFDLFGILDNVNAFLILFIAFGAAVGAFSRKASIAAFGGLLVFTHIVMETDLFIFDGLLYLVLGLVLLWVSYQVTAGYLEGREGIE